jgi:hypothetical protein
MPRTVHLLVTIELADGRTAEQLRADVERKLGADQASVTLLNNAHDNTVAPPSAEPAEWQRTDPAARERAAYLAAVITALMRRDPALDPYVSPICPECGQIPEPDDDGHSVLGAVVVIGCEGYWVINPNVVGIHRPTWQPQD